MKSSRKKTYERAKVTVVKLNPGQAVLSVCSTTFSSAKASGSQTTCKSGSCKKHSSGGDSASQC